MADMNLQHYCLSMTNYKRLPTKFVDIGSLQLGGHHPIRVQTMTTTDTMNTEATVEQTIRCIEAGAELVRITAPSKNEAENLKPIRDSLHAQGYHTPLVADIHFTPNAAEIAAGIVEKVRINPGNFVDKKKFEQLEYTDEEYKEEVDRIRTKFLPLIRICHENDTAMRIGTNHGSLSDRIMSRYGDTAIGMVESAMEFLRIAREENFHRIVLSMKSSNPQVMIQAYRLLVHQMHAEFGECYPLHLGVTEAGDGEDGRIKSAIGIGTLLEDGIGDTIRVSLTEDPEFELPVCRDIAKRYENANSDATPLPEYKELHFDPFQYKRQKTEPVGNIGGTQVPVVIADMSMHKQLTADALQAVGYYYDAVTDKWSISDRAADYLYCHANPEFALPGTLGILLNYEKWKNLKDKAQRYPLLNKTEYLYANETTWNNQLHFVMLDCFNKTSSSHDLQVFFDKIKEDKQAVLCLSSTNKNAVQSIRRMFAELYQQYIKNPVIVISDSQHDTLNEALIHFSVECGALLVDGMSDGICLGWKYGTNVNDYPLETINSIAFGILQATRTRISKTEYISCPSCGRTLFDLQETTARIRAVTHHLKGVKIAIMGCIVNGPGEMADADFGYVGSGVGKITLYKGKEVVKRNIAAEVAVGELIELLKANNAWLEPVGI
jgi:(E)-4-hydroxy-3-methylbut-2-enyl-diphosphate synthase